MSSFTGTAAATPENRPGSSSTNYRSDAIWCNGCSMRVAKDPAQMKLHRSSSSHHDNCKLKGFYCYPCGKAFLGNTEQQAHMKSRKHAIANRDEPNPMPDYPGDQEDTFFQPPQPGTITGAISGPTATAPVSAWTVIESPSANLRAQYHAFYRSFRPVAIGDTPSFPMRPMAKTPPAAAASPSDNLRCQDDVITEDDSMPTRPAIITLAQAPTSGASPAPSKRSLRQHWCDGCMILIDGVSLTEHVKLDTHIENCKRKGFYCELCNKVFFSSKEHRSHNEGKKHKATVEKKAASTPYITTELLQTQNDTSSQSLQPVATEDHDMPPSATPTVGISVQAAVMSPSSDSPSQTWCEGCKIMVQRRGRSKKDHRKSYSHFQNCKREGLHCEACDGVFFTKDGLKSHCDLDCSKRVTVPMPAVKWTSNLSARNNMTHPQPQPVGTSDEPTLNLPVVASFHPNPRWCMPCDVFVERGAVWKCHRTSITHIDNCKRKGLYCPPCDKIFKTENGLQIHHSKSSRHYFAVASNAPVSVPVVTNGSESTTSASQNDTHPQSDSPQPDEPSETRQCDICLTLRVPGESFWAHERTQVHMDAYNALGLDCPECRTAFEGGTIPRPHQCKPVSPVVSEPGDFEFHCGSCGQVFLSQKQIEKHPDNCGLAEPTEESTIHTPTPKPASPSPSPSPSPGFRCEACRIWIESSLDRHLQSEIHIENCKLMGLYYCIPCNRPFFTKSSLSNHEVKFH